MQDDAILNLTPRAGGKKQAKMGKKSVTTCDELARIKKTILAVLPPNAYRKTQELFLMGILKNEEIGMVKHALKTLVGEGVIVKMPDGFIYKPALKKQTVVFPNQRPVWNKHTSRSPIPAALWQDIVCAITQEFELAPEAIFSPRRTPIEVEMRKIFCHLMKKLHFGPVAIGLILRIHHSSVLYLQKSALTVYQKEFVNDLYKTHKFNQ